MKVDIYAAFARFYDLYVGDRDEDLPFYLGLCHAAGGPVLEIGAGTGRLTVPVARAGIPVVAVDASPAMLALLRERLAEEPAVVTDRIRIVQADACRLDIAERFPFVFMPFFTFNYMLTVEMQLSALDGMARHLTPDGRAALDLFLPLRRIKACPQGPVLRVDTIDPRTGRRVKAWNTYEMDVERRIETRTHAFEMSGDSGEVHRTEFVTRRRWFVPEELEPLFSEAGLRLDSLTGGYRGEPLADDSETIVCLLRREEGR